MPLKALESGRRVRVRLDSPSHDHERDEDPDGRDRRNADCKRPSTYSPAKVLRHIHDASGLYMPMAW
jgi:hypothetical protein